MAEPLHKEQNRPCQNKTKFARIKGRERGSRRLLVTIFGHERQAVQENQKQIAGAKIAYPYVYENAHQLVGVNIQNDRLKTRVLRCYISAGRNVARCRLNVASGWLLYRTR